MPRRWQLGALGEQLWYGLTLILKQDNNDRSVAFDFRNGCFMLLGFWSEVLRFTSSAALNPRQIRREVYKSVMKYIVLMALTSLFGLLACAGKPPEEPDMETTSVEVQAFIVPEKIVDDRGRFREIFCTVLEEHGHDQPWAARDA